MQHRGVRRLVIAIAYAEWGDSALRHSEAFADALAELGWRWSWSRGDDGGLFDERNVKIPDPQYGDE